MVEGENLQQTFDLNDFSLDELSNELGALKHQNPLVQASEAEDNKKLIKTLESVNIINNAEEKNLFTLFRISFYANKVLSQYTNGSVKFENAYESNPKNHAAFVTMPAFENIFNKEMNKICVFATSLIRGLIKYPNIKFDERINMTPVYMNKENPTDFEILQASNIFLNMSSFNFAARDFEKRRVFLQSNLLQKIENDKQMLENLEGQKQENRDYYDFAHDFLEGEIQKNQNSAKLFETSPMQQFASSPSPKGINLQ